MVEETSLTTTKYDLFNKCLLPQGSFTMQVTFFSDGIVYGHVISKGRLCTIIPNCLKLCWLLIKIGDRLL